VRSALVLALLLALAAPPLARADDSPAHREVPDLDGRPEQGPDPALDAALWISRVLTSPLYLVSEYVIRAPLAAFFTELERAGLIDWLFASGGPVSVVPTAFFEFGLSPSIGIYAAYDGLGFAENRASLHAATFGEDWLRLIVRDRVRFAERFELALRFEARRRPDQILEGIGFDATQAPRGRFAVDLLEGRVELKLSYWRGGALLAQAGYRNVGFRESTFQGDPSVLMRGAPPPTGYLSGYELAFFRFDLLFDSHEPTGELSRARFRMRVLVEQNAAFGGLMAEDPRLFSSFVRWGGELAASSDFLGAGRVFMLRFRTELVSPLAPGAPIPFSELPDAAGRGPLPGFITGQLRGESVIGLALEYVWPVYALLDGFTLISVGNAFGTHYEGFELDRLRMSWQIGIVPRFDGEHMIEISFGLGTETFERGAELSQARLVVGARHGL